MARVITFSQLYPAYHPKKGQPTFFVEKYWEANNIDLTEKHIVLTQLNVVVNQKFEPKHHTIRKGSRWKEGDWFSPRAWSGVPYYSKQVIIGPDCQIKKIYQIKIQYGYVYINGRLWAAAPANERSAFGWLAMNDGLTATDLFHWFEIDKLKPFEGQIICWSNKQFPYWELKK